MRLSYSSLNTYQQCSLKYKYREIDHIAEPKSKEQVFGTLIHSTMKSIHTSATLPPSLEQAMNYFAKRWNSDVFNSPAEERAAFSQGVQIIQKYYRDNDISRATILDLESAFRIEIGEKHDRHTVSGIIDRIDKTPDGYEIIDYKTSRKMPSQQDIDNDVQLSIYCKAFLDRYPKERERISAITVSLYFLKHGVKLSSTRTAAQLENVESVFLYVIHRITKNEFEPTLSPLCDWCGYQKICPLWKHKFADTRKLETDDVKQAISDYLNLKGKLSGEKIHLAKLQALILQYMEQEGVDRVFDNYGIIGKSIRKTYKYDEGKLRSILEPLDKWKDVLKVDGIALHNILTVLPSPVRKEVENAKTLDKESVGLSIKKNTIEADEALNF